jgi:2-oxoisovalerate dehydrogenase E1 component
VIDLRWLQPWDESTVLAHARALGRVLVVDEGRYTGGLSEAVLARVSEIRVAAADAAQAAGVIGAAGPSAAVRSGTSPKVARLTGDDVYIPLGTAWTHVLPSEDRIVAAARALVRP